MPVVATITTIALLRGGGAAPAPFFDPELMREMLNEGLDGKADSQLRRSLEITTRLEQQLDRYRDSVDRGVDAYIEAFSDRKADASDLIARLDPLDRERRNVLNSIIEYRRELADILDDAEWGLVFG